MKRHKIFWITYVNYLMQKLSGHHSGEMKDFSIFESYENKQDDRNLDTTYESRFRQVDPTINLVRAINENPCNGYVSTVSQKCADFTDKLSPRQSFIHDLNMHASAVIEGLPASVGFDTTDTMVLSMAIALEKQSHKRVELIGEKTSVPFYEFYET